MKAKITNRTGRRSKCIHCARTLIEVREATDEYISVYGTDDEVWMDSVEGRALCLVNCYSTAHITASEWKAAQ